MRGDTRSLTVLQLPPSVVLEMEELLEKFYTNLKQRKVNLEVTNYKLQLADDNKQILMLLIGKDDQVAASVHFDPVYLYLTNHTD